MTESETKTARPNAPGSLAQYVACIKRGDKAMHAHHFDEAIEAFDEAIALRPEMYEGHFKLGNAYMYTDDLLAAVKSYSKAYDRQPKEMELLLRLSEVCYRMQDYHKAAQMLAEVLIINDRYIPALCVLPELLTKLGFIDDALDLLKAAIPVQPHIPELWIAAGIAIQAKGDNERAITFYREALNIDPKATVAIHNLGMLTKAA